MCGTSKNRSAKKHILRQSTFHSAGATLLRNAEAFMYLQHKCPCGGKHLSLKNPARTANKPGMHRRPSPCALPQGRCATAKTVRPKHSVNTHTKRPPGTVPASLNLPTMQEGCMGAAPASPEGLKNRRTVAKQVAPAKTDSLGMSEKLRKTPATMLPAFFLTPLKKRFCGRRLSKNSYALAAALASRTRCFRRCARR